MNKILIAGMMIFGPAIALAQGAPSLANVGTLVESISRIINLLIPVVAALALLYFFWGLAVFILNAGDEEKRKKGRDIMIWGIVALFVLASVWGIVSFLGGALGVNIGEDLTSLPSVSDSEIPGQP